MGNSVRIHSQQRDSGGQGTFNEDVCADCSVSFNLFCRRRQFCSTCMSPFCTSCMLNSASENSQPSRQRCCRRCRVFNKSDLVWEDLMCLKTRDLVWYFKERNVRPQANVPKEKEELAQWVLEHIGGEQYQSGTDQRQEQVTRMTEEMDVLRQSEQEILGNPHVTVTRTDQDNMISFQSGSNVRTIYVKSRNKHPESSQHTHTISLQNNGNDENGASRDNDAFRTEEDNAIPQLTSVTSRNESQIPSLTPVNIVRTPSQNQIILEEQHLEHGSRASLTIIVNEGIPETNSASSSVRVQQLTGDGDVSLLTTQRVTLPELHSESAVDELSVKQLKDLLASNFVDYKGCCEKQELQIRAKRLWNSSQDNQRRLTQAEGTNPTDSVLPVVGSGGVLETEECKVCMDAPVDCVFLECGHMVTCVTCGKQLSECPVCRQYIVRAVRIFRS